MGPHWFLVSGLVKIGFSDSGPMPSILRHSGGTQGSRMSHCRFRNRRVFAPGPSELRSSTSSDVSHFKRVYPWSKLLRRI